MPESMGLFSSNFFVAVFKRSIFSTIECISAVQGHPRSMILVAIKTAHATSY